MVAQREARGEHIARGNTSDVWRWSRSSVVKVLRPEIPRHWAALEADITRRVHEAGLPVPATEGVVEVDGRPAVLLERIEGRSMWHHMKDSPADVPRLVEELVDLQAEVLSVGPVDGLPDLESRLHAKIDAADELPLDERAEAQQLLSALPRGTALCHGDMHPANLLRSSRGWFIVDWFDAAVGNGQADLARSALLMPPAASLGSASRHLDGASVEVLGRLHDAYLASLRRRGLIDAERFEAWRAVLAVARMSEPVERQELRATWQGWRAGSPAVSGPASPD